MLRQLFYINSYGQIDGSGIMWMDKKGNTDYLKAALASPTFMELKSFDRIKDGLYKNKFVAGHTRYSTVGGNTWENSHPFEYGNFMGIQNGTISNSHKSLVQGKVSPCEVDSASVFWSFDQQGVSSTLDRYEGEGVFMFFNKQQQSFNVVKNFYRTLHVAKIDKLEVYILATDKFALEFVAERNGIVLEKVVKVRDDTLISYNMDNTVDTEFRDVPPPAIKYYNYASFGGKGYNNYKPYTAPKTQPKVTAKDKSLTTFNPSGRATVSNTTKDTVVSTQKDKPDPARKRIVDTHNYYIADCDICLNPIHTGSVMYADDPDPLRAQYISCSCCEKELKDYTGQPTYTIKDTLGLVK